MDGSLIDEKFINKCPYPLHQVTDIGVWLMNFLVKLPEGCSFNPDIR